MITCTIPPLAPASFPPRTLLGHLAAATASALLVLGLL
jgi:hypothetical protein